jgi:hypothetical protein
MTSNSPIIFIKLSILPYLTNGTNLNNYTLIAFAFHQVFELTDRLYQICRLELGSKKNLWDHIRAYLKLFVFETWEALISFTLNPEHYLPDRMPAPA